MLPRWIRVGVYALFIISSCLFPAETTTANAKHTGSAPEESALSRWRREQSGRQEVSCKDMREVAANMQREEVMKVMQTWVRKLGPAVEWQQAMSGRHQELENFRVGMEQTVNDLRERSGRAGTARRGIVVLVDLDWLPMPGSHGFTARKLASGFELHGYSTTTIKTEEELQLIPDSEHTIFLISEHFLKIVRAPLRADRNSNIPLEISKSLWVSRRPQNVRQTQEVVERLSSLWPRSFFLLFPTLTRNWPVWLPIPFRRFLITGGVVPGMAPIRYVFWVLKLVLRCLGCIEFAKWPPPTVPLNFVPYIFAAAIAPDKVGADDVDFDERYLDAHFVGNYYKTDWTKDLSGFFIHHTEKLDPVTAVTEYERIEAMRHSKVVLGFHSDENLEMGIVTERVFEGMAYGCVVLTDNPWAVEITDGIAVLVETKEEFLEQLQAFVSNRTKTEERKQRGFQYAREKGTYFHLAARYMDEMRSPLHAGTESRLRGESCKEGATQGMIEGFESDESGEQIALSSVEALEMVDSPPPMPHDRPAAFSVRQLQRFAWDLNVHGAAPLNFTVFLELQDWNPDRSLPPSGRETTFAEAFRLFEVQGGQVVVELGCTRSFVDGRYPGCNGGCFDGPCTPEEVARLWRPTDPSYWDWGAGMFGRVAALCLQHVPDVELHQVDLSEAHLARATAMNADVPFTHLYHTSSEEFLSGFEGQIDLLYLDTGDISPIEPSARLQEREARIIVDRDLIAPGGLILIDDVLHPTPVIRTILPVVLRISYAISEGKAKYSLPFLLANGFELLQNEFQVLLRKTAPSSVTGLQILSPRNNSILTEPQGASGWLHVASHCDAWPPNAQVVLHVDGSEHLRVANGACYGPGCSLCSGSGIRGPFKCEGWIESGDAPAGPHWLSVAVSGTQAPCLAVAPAASLEVHWTTVPRPRSVQCAAGQGHRSAGECGAAVCGPAGFWREVASLVGARHVLELSLDQDRTPQLLDVNRHLTSLFLGSSDERLEQWAHAVQHVRAETKSRGCAAWTPLRAAAVAAGPTMDQDLRSSVEAISSMEHHLRSAVRAALELSNVDAVLVPCAEDALLAQGCGAAVRESLENRSTLAAVVAHVDAAMLSSVHGLFPTCELSVGKDSGCLSSHREKSSAASRVLVWTSRTDVCLKLLERHGCDSRSQEHTKARGAWNHDPIKVSEQTAVSAQQHRRQSSVSGEAVTPGNGRGQLRVLHLGFHNGARREVELVGRELGLVVDFETFPGAEGEDDGCQKFNVDAAASARAWQQHGERWKEYDVIITSDTAPIARTFMEHGRLGNRTLIVWVCNRFDYRCNGPDRTPPYKPHFPEPEFYALYADAAQGRLGPNVHMVPYNTFERTYAKSLGVDMYAEVLRPSGLQALIDASEVTATGNGGDGSELPPEAEAREIFFLPPRGNDRYMAVQCQELQIPCFFSSRDMFVSANGERLSAPTVLVYATASQLTRFKAIIHIPYAWSTFAMFEFAMAGVVIIIPTRRFFLELASSCIAWGARVCDAAPEYEMWFPNFPFVVEPEVLDDAEWWDPQNKELFVFFDSWEELQDHAQNLDFEAQRRRVREWASSHRSRTLEQWRSLIFGDTSQGQDVAESERSRYFCSDNHADQEPAPLEEAVLGGGDGAETAVHVREVIWWAGKHCSNMQGLKTVMDECRQSGSPLLVRVFSPEQCLMSHELDRHNAFPCKLTQESQTFSSPSLAFASHIASYTLRSAEEEKGWALFVEHGREMSVELVRQWLQHTLALRSSDAAGGWIRLHRPSWDLTVSEGEREECMLSSDAAGCLSPPQDLCKTLATSLDQVTPTPSACLRIAATPAASFAASFRWLRHAASALKRLPLSPFLLPRAWESIAQRSRSTGGAGSQFERLLQHHFGGLLSASTAPRLHPNDFATPSGRLLRVFVYELPSAAHAQPLAAMLEQMLESSVGCGPGLGPCEVQETEQGWAVAHQHAVEVFVLAKWLRAAQVPGVLTTNPHEADVLLIPWLGSLSVGARNGRGRPLSHFKTQLPWLDDQQLKPKHLVLCSTEGWLPTDVYTNDLRVMAGDARPQADAWTRELLEDSNIFRMDFGVRKHGDAKHLIMPQPALDPAFQHVPGVVGGGQEIPDMDAVRNLSVFACVGLRNGENQFGQERNRVARMLIGLDQWWAQTDDVLVLVLPLKDGMDFTHVHRQMGRAVFCPTPPGENPDGTPRFFMSVAAGCIPVMFAHPRRDGGISWHAENGARFEDTMPFSSVIDFHRLVVLVPSSVRDSRALAEYLAGVTEEEIRAKQAYGASVRGLLGYAFSGVVPDMFSAVIQQIAGVLGL